MAESQCSRGHKAFEAKPTNVGGLPKGSQFVQCAECGVVVGVLDRASDGFYPALQALEERLSTKIDAIARATQ